MKIKRGYMLRCCTTDITASKSALFGKGTIAYHLVAPVLIHFSDPHIY
ncbi:hypothetical protein N9L76_01860 [bacterium]|nr:hypothetical protein [bacterium]|tara:strand:- start:3972 stop:4115 length:144 start_codon:yes stop_codon:yes gene_type:complete